VRRAIALLGALLCLAPSLAGAATLQPATLPDGTSVGSAPNAIRYAGVDRYHTSAAIAAALGSDGTLPFDTPNPAGTTWGAATCPSSIIVVAGDRPADALAAAPLSDPTDRSDQPRLRRVASRDPDFDPPGGMDRVDTFAAPILVTTSTRSGATRLAAAAREAAADLVDGTCDDAREAVIVGGTDAVPVGAETELLLLGYEEVFRVAGADRYETAALVAAALPVEAAPAGAQCTDADASDGSTAMGFYGNGVIEFRPTPTACELHGRTVVLADAVVGADALAAGWWTSYWQTPLLFVAPDGSLPPATRSALESLAVDTLVVLGGTARIPESTVDEAKVLASAVAGRFGGADRYSTSTITATQLGGWHPTGDADDFDADRICLAASSGASTGWPDALAAGPWCGRLTASTAPAPSRMLEPVERATAPAPATAPSHAAAPLLLVPAGGPIPASVRNLLSAAFAGGEAWCRGGTVGACAAPGFAVAFGGGAVLAQSALEDVSGLLAGDDEDQRTAAPTLGDPFTTTLDLSSRFTGDGPGAHTCFERGSIRGVRWLATYDSARLDAPQSLTDLPTTGGYDDGRSIPRCIARTDAAETLVGVAASGEISLPHALGTPVDAVLSMSGAMRHASPGDAAGEAGTSPDVGITRWQFRDAPPGPLELVHRGGRVNVAEASLDLTLDRQQVGPHRFVARVVLLGDDEPIVGTATGEAALVAGTWQLAGRFRLAYGSGGFAATLSTNSTADNADDGVTWQIDAFAPR
jgi:hypothetical protein